MDLFEKIERYGFLMRCSGDTRRGVNDQAAFATAAKQMLAEIRAEYAHSGRSPMPADLVYRMQSLVVQFAGFDLESRRNADELDLMHNEAGSVKRAIEAWYEQTSPEGGA